MEELALEGLEDELSGHRYQNRTGNLESSTRVESWAGGDGAVVELIMGGIGGSEEYAEWIADEGWSEFRSIGDRVSKRIATGLSR